MRMQRNQQGLTAISWLVIIAVAGFFIMIGLKLVPISLQHMSIQSVIEGLNDDPLVRGKGSREVRDMIYKRFKINGIYDFPKEELSVKKKGNEVFVDVTYERREPVVANISVVVSFSEKAVIRAGSL